MDDEFNEYLSKFNEEMSDKNINPGADRSFLDKKDKPTDSMIIDLFITDDDKANAIDLTNYKISELGNPDKIKTIEGTEWVLSKLVWFRKEGRVITFDIVQISSSIEDIKNAKHIRINPIASKNAKTIDITFEDVTDKHMDYHQILDVAIEEENYNEAARLRDWLTDFKDMSDKLFPLMQKAIHSEDFNLYNKYMKQINAHTDKL